MQMLWPMAPVSIAIIPEVESTSALAMKSGNPVGSLVVEGPVAVDHEPLAAGTGAVHDADFGPVLIGDLEAEIGDRLLGRRDPKCISLSLRRTAFASIQADGSKLRTSPAALCSYGDGSNRVISSRPETPLTRLDQAVATSFPTGLMTPSPVIATRRL